MDVISIGPIEPYKGGIAQYNSLLIKNLSKKYKTEAISWKRQYPNFLLPIEQLDKKGKSLVKKDKRFMLDFYNPFSWLKAFFYIKNRKPKLVIFHWLTPAMSPIYSFISFLIKKFTKTKTLALCHNVLPHERRFVDKFLTKMFFRQIDFFIVHSKKCNNDLIKLKKNCEVTQGFLAKFAVLKKIKHDKKKLKAEMNLKNKVILFFGFIRKYKGLTTLIKAMPLILKKIDLDLLIVGEFWDDKKQYLKLIKKLGLEKNIKIVSRYVKNDEVSKFFSVSDVCVLPYNSATQSGIIQVSFDFDTPVITTNVGGLKEVIKDNETGYLVNARDIEGLAKAVIKFYKEKKSEKFIINVKKEKRKYSWDNYIKLIEKYINP